MLKRTRCFLLALSTAFCLTVVALASNTEGGITQAEIQGPALYVNEQLIQDAGLNMIDGVAYMPIRVFFDKALPGCQVEWVNGQAVVTGLTAQGEPLTVTARPGNCYVVANERYLYTASHVRTIQDLTMAPVAVLAQIFSGSSVWSDQDSYYVQLGEALLISGKNFYDPTALDLLARLIHAEAGNQSMAGKIAVGNVIFNRMGDPRFPSTLYDVIYAKNQFSVVKSGAINRTPSEVSLIAAKLAIEGAEVVRDALYFHRSGLNCWASRNCTYVTTIGGHDFYA